MDSLLSNVDLALAPFGEVALPEALDSDPVGRRSCARCSKDLTDAASMECGVGPICRKMDNALYAATIPADVTAALTAWRAAATRLLQALSAEAHPTLEKVGAELLEGGATGRDDWRSCVKRLEWLASRGGDRRVLASIARGLGYVAVAAMLLGEGSVGRATVTCEGDRVYVQGPRNSAANARIKAIQGRRFHPAEGGKKARWSVPCASAAALADIVREHYPTNAGLTEAVEQAGRAPAAKPAAPAAPTCTAKLVGNEATVRTPYSANFVADLKFFFKRRRWEPVTKTWIVQLVADDQGRLDHLVKKHFGHVLVWS